VETLHGDRLADRRLGDDESVDVEVVVVFRVRDRRSEDLARVLGHRLLGEGQDVHRVFDLAAADQGGDEVELLGGTTNGGADRKSFLLADAAGCCLLAH